MTELRDFLNWFDGFAENIDKTPNQKQWDKIKQRVAELKAVPSTSSDAAVNTVQPLKLVPKPAAPKYTFYIDTDGMAKNAKGVRILPQDVTSDIHDLRGIDGDTRTVTWADGSQGVRGLNATIVAA
jgi:hypothetical protein